MAQSGLEASGRGVLHRCGHRRLDRAGVAGDEQQHRFRCPPARSHAGVSSLSTEPAETSGTSRINAVERPRVDDLVSPIALFPARIARCRVLHHLILRSPLAPRHSTACSRNKETSADGYLRPLPQISGIVPKVVFNHPLAYETANGLASLNLRCSQMEPCSG